MDDENGGAMRASRPTRAECDGRLIIAPTEYDDGLTGGYGIRPYKDGANADIMRVTEDGHTGPSLRGGA